jgi:protocatechuate 3,4-dioxygenase beta subunit
MTKQEQQKRRFITVIVVGCLSLGVVPSFLSPPSVSRMLLTAAHALPVSVRVVDEANAPIAGAKVWFVTGEIDSVRVATTDANGIATADVAEYGGDGSLGGMGWVTALAPGKGIGGGPILKSETAGGMAGNVAAGSPRPATTNAPAPQEIKLGPRVSLVGKVQDKDGKPVPNAAVKLMFVFPQFDELTEDTIIPTEVIIGEGPEWEELTVRSDAAGRWAMDFLPPGLTAHYELIDERFIRLRGSSPLPATGMAEAKTLVASPGAILTGRVVDDKGQPLANVTVQADNGALTSNRDNATTGADGTYRMTRLGPGSTALMATSTKITHLVALPPKPVRTKVGESVTAPDIVFSPGAIVEGRVTDVTNGKPIQGVSIMFPGNRAITDAAGNYRVHAQPGDAAIYVMGKPTEYNYPKLGSPAKQLRVTLVAGAVKELSFALPPSQTLEGVVQDEAGQPVAGVTVNLGEYWLRLRAKTDKQGRFSIRGADEGDLKLSVGKDWEVIKPLQVKVPRPTPVTVQLRRVQKKPLMGRVVDETGVPVAGATISVQETTQNVEYPSDTRALITDADGRWSWTPQRPDGSFKVTAKKETYRFVSGGIVQPPRQVMTISGVMIPDTKADREITDIVLQKLSARLAGRVLDEQGKPLEGVSIWTPTSETVSAADGSWQLLNQPPDTVIEILAARDKYFGRETITLKGDIQAGTAAQAGTADKPNAALDIILKPLVVSPPDATTTRAYAEALLADGTEATARAILPFLAMTDPDAALIWAGKVKPVARAVANTANAPRPFSDAEVRAEIAARALNSFARYDAKRSGERIPDLLGALPAPASGPEAIKLAREIAPYLPDEAREIFNRAKALLPPANSGKTPPQETVLALASLAARLGMNDEAFALADPAIDKFVAAQGKNSDYYSWRPPVDAVAAGGSLLFERLLARYPAERKAYAVRRAIPILARIDLGSARRLLETIPGKPTELDGDNEYQFETEYHRAVFAVLERLAPSEPAAALAIARRVTSPQYQGKALALAASGAQGPERSALLREAFDYPSGFFGVAGRLPIARHAAMLEPALGESLLLEVAQGMVIDDDGPLKALYGEQTAELAWVLGRMQPGRARLLLEKEWSSQTESWYRHQLVAAMAILDWKRAREMADSAEATTAAEAAGNAAVNERNRIVRLLAQVALAPANFRQRSSLFSIQEWTLDNPRSLMD